MAKLNVKTGDTVLVITGKDAGKQGKVLKVAPKNNRVIVEGVNIISKAHKARSAQDKSEIRKIEGAIDISNVMPVCPKCGKATRVHNKVIDGKSVRVCKCGASLDEKPAKVENKKAAKPAEAKAETKAEEKPAKKAAEKKTTKAAETKVKATKTAAAKNKIATGKSAQRGV